MNLTVPGISLTMRGVDTRSNGVVISPSRKSKIRSRPLFARWVNRKRGLIVSLRAPYVVSHPTRVMERTRLACIMERARLACIMERTRLACIMERTRLACIMERTRLACITLTAGLPYFCAAANCGRCSRYQAIVVFKPSTRSFSGVQSSSFLARLMSGRRRLGSSVGNGS